MAINDAVPGVVIEVTVDDEALKEHEDFDLENEERTITRYIEAASGQIFAVRISLEEDFVFLGDCVSFEVSVDGKVVDSPLIREESDERIMISEGRTSECGTRVSKYRFTSLETVSDGRTTAKEVSEVKDLGSIVVKCVHEYVDEETAFEHNGEEASAVGIVSEKALKGRALSHAVEFAPESKQEKATVYSTLPVEDTPNPAASFVFCYRDRNALKSILIIRRTPTPPPLEERDLATLSKDELKELQKQLREMKVPERPLPPSYGRSAQILISRQEREASKIKIKREKADVNPRPRKISRPNRGDTQLEMSEDGGFREASTSTLAADEKIVIELD